MHDKQPPVLTAASISTAQAKQLDEQLLPMSALEAMVIVVVTALFTLTPLTTEALLKWVILAAGVLAVRVLLLLLVRGRSDTPHRAILMLLALLPAGMLGSAGYLLTPLGSLFAPEWLFAQMASSVLALGLCMIALAAYGSHRATAMGYLILVMAPTTAMLVHTDSAPNALLTWLSAALLLALLYFAAAQRLFQHFKRNLALQQQNQHLISFLEQSHQDAVALNQQLNQEMTNRKDAQLSLEQTNAALEDTVQSRTRDLKATTERLQLALVTSNVGLWDWDVDGGNTFHLNTEQLLGHKNDRFASFFDELDALIHPQDLATVRKALTAHLKQQAPDYHAVFRLRHADGGWRWYEDRGKVISRNDNGHALRMIGTRRDITEERNARDQLKLSATVFENAPEGIFILDEHFRFLAVNTRLEQITGYSEAELVGKDATHKALGERDPKTYIRIRKELESSGFWEGEILERRRDGEQFPEWMQISAVKDEEKQVVHYVGMMSDLTARKETEQQLQFLSNFDRLTGLANRTQFRQQLHKALTLARLNRETLALVMLDLDRFKPINESLGHEIGDLLLKAVAERLLECGVDEQQLARVGGDEFTLVLDHGPAESDIHRQCITIINAFKRPFHIKGHELRLGTSIGVSLFPSTAKDAQEMINQADMAVQAAKRAGGNTHQFYTSVMGSSSKARLAMETDLRKAVERNEFVVHYQPKLRLSDGKIDSVEALVRWQHPSRGLVGPGDFIFLAEESGLISAIGLLVLESACIQAKAWLDAGVGPIRVSVNLSAHQFRKGNLAAIVEEVLAMTQLPAQYLELELTESLLMEDLDKNLAILGQLREQGIELALDDFGTGYSSLSYLKRFPVDTLKIDRSFIMELHNNPDDAAITRAIIDMAHCLNMLVVAEGVETDAQLGVLRDMGCDSIQGYLISKPLPADALENLLKNQVPLVKNKA